MVNSETSQPTHPLTLPSLPPSLPSSLPPSLPQDAEVVNAEITAVVADPDGYKVWREGGREGGREGKGG